MLASSAVNVWCTSGNTLVAAGTTEAWRVRLPREGRLGDAFDAGLERQQAAGQGLLGKLLVGKGRAHGRQVEDVQVGAAEDDAGAARDRQLDDAFQFPRRIVTGDAAEHRLRAPDEALGVDGHAVGEGALV